MMKACTPTLFLATLKALGPFPVPCRMCGQGPRSFQPTRLLSGGAGRGQGSGCYRDVTSMFFQRGPPGGHTGGPEQGRNCAKGVPLLGEERGQCLFG